MSTDHPPQLPPAEAPTGRARGESLPAKPASSDRANGGSGKDWSQSEDTDADAGANRRNPAVSFFRFQNWEVGGVRVSLAFLPVPRPVLQRPAAAGGRYATQPAATWIPLTPSHVLRGPTNSDCGW
jgi:hypothetical protein